jgi:hypothetical protein
MNPVKQSPKSWLLLLFVVAPLVLVLSLSVWHAAGAHAAIPRFLQLALGFGLFGMSALSVRALVLRPRLSLTARLVVILGPIVGCASAGLGSIVLALWPRATVPLYLFVVSVIAFPVAVILGIVLRIPRHGRRSPAPSPPNDLNPSEEMPP